MPLIIILIAVYIGYVEITPRPDGSKNPLALRADGAFLVKFRGMISVDMIETDQLHPNRGDCWFTVTMYATRLNG